MGWQLIPRIILALIGWWILGCSNASLLDHEGSCVSSTPVTLDRPPTFADDILPLLGSNVAGRSFRCVVCHESYKRFSVVATVQKIEQIIAAVSAAPGSALAMPPASGNRLSAADIDVLKRWRDAGFPNTAADLPPAVNTDPQTNPMPSKSPNGATDRIPATPLPPDQTASASGNCT